MSSSFSHQYDVSVTIAKAFGIIMVVIGHVYPKDSYFVHFIYCFHMPLFFLLSGFFFKTPQKPNDIIHFVWKRIKRLYFPFLKWSFLFILINNLLLSLGVGWASKYETVDSMIKDAIYIGLTFAHQNPIILGFWFLKELFLSSTFICIFTYLLRKLNENFRIFIVISLCIIIPLLLLKEHIDNKTVYGMFYGAFFYYCGFIYKKLNINISLLEQFSILIVVLIGSVAYNNVYTMELLNTDIDSILPFAVLGVLGSILIHQLSQKIKLPTMYSGGIIYIGNHTLTILALHYPAICIYQRFCVSYDSSCINGFTKVLVGVLVPCFFSLAINYSKGVFKKNG